LADDLDRSTSKFGEAIAAAQKQMSCCLLSVKGGLSGEARSRAILDLPGAQNALVDAVAATGNRLF